MRMSSMKVRAASLVEYCCVFPEMVRSFADVARGACLDKGDGPAVRDAAHPIQGRSHRVLVDLV